MFDPYVALLAVLLLAISPWHLYWSQNARFYTSLLLFYTLALFTFYFGIEEDRPWYLLLSLFFLGLAIKERQVALFLVPVVVSYLFLLKILPFEKPAGLRLRNLALLFVPGLLAALFMAWPYVRQPARWNYEFSQFFVWTNNNPYWILAGVVYYIGLPIICVGASGALYLLLKKDRAALLLSVGALGPLLAIMIISLVFYTANRYVFVSLMSWIALASVAIKELLQQTQRNARILAVGALLILLLAPLSENVLYFKYQNGNRDKWKNALALVKQQKEADDLIVVPDTKLGNYYLQEDTINMSRVDLADIKETGKRVWFVEDMNVQWKFPGVLAWIEKNTFPVANFDVSVRARTFKMRIYLYDTEKSTSQALR
jgi:4-amino-4-deoxy-L-arabinose transferase-like glycosyltransferase